MKQFRLRRGSSLLAAARGADAGASSNEYYFFAGYVVLQFIVLATAWNILGGYAGYVNFGTGAFFGVGAYTAVVLFKAMALPLSLQILAARGDGRAARPRRRPADAAPARHLLLHRHHRRGHHHRDRA